MGMNKRWPIKSVGELCTFGSGNGFSQSEWSTEGLPIIRIQNLNGSDSFNYFDGVPDPSWIVEPGDLLFAWAGVKGVSFGPTIWNGPRGVLNQHIYKITPNNGVDLTWLYYALSIVTETIESKAHGFKTNLVHVRKSDITNATIAVPSLEHQQNIVKITSNWDHAIALAARLIQEKKRLRDGLITRTIGASLWNKSPLLRADELFAPVSTRGRPDLPLLAVTQDRGVIPREWIDRRIQMVASDPANFKVVRPGNFVISLRSFQGGIEYSEHEGLVSPAYTVLKADQRINPSFYRHYLKSNDFLQRLSVAVVGIRDGKQISFSDFASLRLPLPPSETQATLASVLDDAEQEMQLLMEFPKLLQEERRGLVQNLLAGAQCQFILAGVSL